jgi:hypothetical protein
VFWCSSLGGALTFAHFGSSSHSIVFLAILGTMCHLSLSVWTNTLYVCLFILFVFVCIRFFFAMLLIVHDLHRNYGLHAIDVFNLFEHNISLEILMFDLCVGLERLYLFDFFSHAH